MPEHILQIKHSVSLLIVVHPPPTDVFQCHSTSIAHTAETDLLTARDCVRNFLSKEAYVRFMNYVTLIP